MALPNPTKNMTDWEFVSEFIINPEAIKKYPEETYRELVAYRIWHEFKNNSYTMVKSNMSQLVKKDTFEGKKHLVVPTVLIVAGVLNNVLYTPEELKKFPKAWNGIPVPVKHPQSPYGQPISANDPKVVQNQSVGRLWNVRFEDDRLKGEIWINIEKCRKIAPEILKKLENNERIEVSTGLYTEEINEEGIHNGIPYYAIAINYRPDHLAILPNEKGACSWEDGAGMPRINHDKGGVVEDLKTLMKKMANLVGFEVKDEIDKNKGPEIREIKPILEINEDEIMAEEKSKEDIIANVEVKKESEKEIELVAKEKEIDVNKEVEVNKEIEIPEKKDVKPMTINEFIDTAPEEYKGLLLEGLKQYEATKNDLVGKLLNNKLNQFTAEELALKSNAELTKITALCKNVVVNDFSASAGAPKTNNKGKVPMVSELTWD